jgi:hypothetical protein
MVWVEPERDPNWDIAVAIRDSFRRNLKILNGDYPKPYALFGNQWQIPHWETGAPGMARFAEAVLRGEVEDSLSPSGERRPLFLNGQIPNHGVLGRRGAAGYLQRVATELGKRGLDGRAAESAAEFMNRSSEMFQTLRYQTDLMKGGELLTLIAQEELGALAEMRKAWEQVKQLTSSRAKVPANA